MTHYDSYGNGPDIFETEGYGFHVDLTARNGEHRYLVWYGSTNSKTGQRKTYRTEYAAIARAKKLAKKGLAVKVSDRLIRPGDTGFLADRSGSYYMDDEGNLTTGSFDEIQELLRETGYWNNPRSIVSLGTIAPGESRTIEVEG